MNLKFVAAIFFAAFVHAAIADEPTTLTPTYLDALRAGVRSEHPSVSAASARIRAADSGIRGVRLWEDPMVGLGFMAAEKQMRSDDGDLMFSLEQVLPRRKLFDAERAKMKAERGMAVAEFQSIAVKLEKLVTQTAVEIALTDEIVAIGTNQVAWLGSMAVNAKERLKDPTGNASEALRIESELAQEKQKLDSNLLMRRRLSRQLSILLGCSPDDVWPSLRLPLKGEESLRLETELEKIASNNPMLQGLSSAAEAARSNIEIAKRQSKPLFSVGVDSRVYSGGDFREASIGAKMTIPLFNKSVYRARVDQAREQESAATYQIQALERELRTEVVTAFTDAENALRQAETFSKNVIPRTEKAAESTENAWITQRASLLEVLESRRAVLNARLEERRFIAAHAAALETLRSIVPPKGETTK